MKLCILGFTILIGAHAFTPTNNIARWRTVASPRPNVPRNAQRTKVCMAAQLPLPKGSLVALATPMTSEGAVDFTALRALLQWHKAEGTDGVVILGTTGEASTLSYEEKEEVMSVTRDELGGDMPIVVGTGTISTEQTIAATKQAQRMGADAALVVTPYYVKPSSLGLQAHFTAIADACPNIPIVLYNVPGRTGVDLSVEATVALSRHPNIAGLKDATGDNSRVGPMRAICGDEFRLYSGEDSMAREYVLQGGDGVISVTANVAPKAMAAVMEAANKGDASSAEAADAPLAALHRDLFCEANPIPVKWALAAIGRCPSPFLRLPLVPLAETYHPRLETALLKAGCPIKNADGSVAGERSDLPPVESWPTKRVLLQGHLFDSGLINQALEIIDKRGGDFSIVSCSTQANDQRTEFKFSRTSTVTIEIIAADTTALDDILLRIRTLVDVMESAEGSLTEIPQ
mmetsp:Transcript_52808/g.104815  ORF Transcript_52808/g.104815 Transcript_52808/m.104815 type:complete len:460 (+) Transcript_52808:21-1400(+)